MIVFSANNENNKNNENNNNNSIIVKTKSMYQLNVIKKLSKCLLLL